MLTKEVIQHKTICDMYQNSLFKSKPLLSIRNEIKIKYGYVEHKYSKYVDMRAAITI
jgi:hypothetical protein